MVISAIGKPKLRASKLVRIKWLAGSPRYKEGELYVQFHPRVSVNEQGANPRLKQSPLSNNQG